MGVLDGAMGSVAQTLVSTFGRSATLKRYSTPVYDDSTGKTSSGTATDVSCSVVFEEFADRQIDGTLIKAGDRKAIVSRLDVTSAPVPDRDELAVDSQTWRIVRVLGHSSGDSEAAYTLHLRR